MNLISKQEAEPEAPRRLAANLLRDLDEIAERSLRMVSRPEPGKVPRYVYLGEKGGGDRLRIGLFAGIHGDEPAGSHALGALVSALEADAELARGYALYLYPLCNPTGYEDGTRFSRSGLDLNRQFWKESTEPEVQFLESEICLHAFDGIVTLHSDDTSEGTYGFASGSVLSKYLLEPALEQAEAFLPRDARPRIDGFEARRGMIYEGYGGTLRSIPGLKSPPFELTLESPQKAPMADQVLALSVALQAILVEYRKLIAWAQNL